MLQFHIQLSCHCQWLFPTESAKGDLEFHDYCIMSWMTNICTCTYKSMHVHVHVYWTPSSWVMNGDTCSLSKSHYFSESNYYPWIVATLSRVQSFSQRVKRGQPIPFQISILFWCVYKITRMFWSFNHHPFWSMSWLEHWGSWRDIGEIIYYYLCTKLKSMNCMFFCTGLCVYWGSPGSWSQVPEASRLLCEVKGHHHQLRGQSSWESYTEWCGEHGGVC